MLKEAHAIRKKRKGVGTKAIKRKKKLRAPTDPTIGADIETMSQEMDQLEYQLFLYDQTMGGAKAKYFELALRIERTVMTEEDRKEVEGEMETLHGHIAEMEDVLTKHRKKLHRNRTRLERVRTAYEALKLAGKAV